ncbi:MAG: hypothetical protein SFY69_13370 [Planctomycetota bacterium]|nr:hypothetical protein [Planctomycetota bacterium]
MFGSRTIAASLVALSSLTLSPGALAAAPAPASAAPAMQVPPPRSAVTGRVQAFATNTYTTFLVAGQLTIIAGKGDGSTDLDMAVYDPAGRLVAWDFRADDRMLVNFIPMRTGIYRIEIRNRGRWFNDFALGIW